MVECDLPECAIILFAQKYDKKRLIGAFGLDLVWVWATQLLDFWAFGRTIELQQEPSHFLRLCHSCYLPKFCLICTTMGIWILFWQFVHPHLRDIKKLVFWPSWSRIAIWANKPLSWQGTYLPKLLFYSNLVNTPFFPYPLYGPCELPISNSHC